MTGAELTLEYVACPMGCPPGERRLMTGHDRAHGLPGEFAVVKCLACGLMRTNPRPTAQALARYYPPDYAPYVDTRVVPGSGSPYRQPAWKRLARAILEPDTRRVPRMTPGRLLDIGCASGSFMHEMAARGWRVQGLEFSLEAAHSARAMGYEVHISTLEEAPDPARPFDLVTAWHTIEHLSDPLGGLIKLGRWTKHGGWLAISVPDAGSWEFALFKDTWYGLWLPVHLYHYTPETLGRLLEAAGWKVRRVLWHNSAANLMHSLGYWSSDRGWIRITAYLHDMARGRRHPYLRLAVGRLLGALHASGRMTVWAQRPG